MLPRRMPVRLSRRPSAYAARAAAVLLAVGGIPWAMADQAVTPPPTAVVAAEGRDSVPAAPAIVSRTASPSATPTASPSPSARGTTQQVLADAYTKAAKSVPASCNLRPSLIAGIGHVESGSIGGRTLKGNVVNPPVIGVILAGNGFAAIPDTDDGKLDGHTTWDRAVGPLQFIPGTWRLFGQDGDKDGRKDPQNVYDAAFATAAYLCSNGKNLADPSHRNQAILEYNQSQEYLDNVLSWAQYFETNGLSALGKVAYYVPNAPNHPVYVQTKPKPTPSSATSSTPARTSTTKAATPTKATPTSKPPAPKPTPRPTTAPPAPKPKPKPTPTPVAPKPSPTPTPTAPKSVAPSQ